MENSTIVDVQVVDGLASSLSRRLDVESRDTAKTRAIDICLPKPRRVSLPSHQYGSRINPRRTQISVVIVEPAVNTI